MTTNKKERIRENIRQRYYNFEFSKEVSDMGFQTLWLEMENLLDQAVKEREDELMRHETKEGWCCACELDIIKLNQIIKEGDVVENVEEFSPDE